MTTVQRVAQIFGWVFIAIGVLGLFLTGVDMDVEPDQVPHLLGLFPVNFLHNLVHLGLGIWGVVAARRWSSAKAYCQGAGVLYLVLMVLGFVAPTLFGLVPLYGNDIWLHAVLGIALAYFGFTAREHRPVGAAHAR